MAHLEQPSFSQSEGRGNGKKFLSLVKKATRVGALAGALAAGQESNQLQAQQAAAAAEAAEQRAHFPIIFDAAANIVMVKTGVKFWGSGLHLSRSKSDIDLMQNGQVARVEITAEGQTGLMVRIFKKPDAEGSAPKVEEIKIFNGFLRPSPNIDSK